MERERSNLENIAKGAYHGFAAGIGLCTETMGLAAYNFVTNSLEDPKWTNRHLTEIPQNRYGVNSAILGGLVSVSLAIGSAAYLITS